MALPACPTSVTFSLASLRSTEDLPTSALHNHTLPVATNIITSTLNNALLHTPLRPGFQDPAKARPPRATTTKKGTHSPLSRRFRIVHASRPRLRFCGSQRRSRHSLQPSPLYIQVELAQKESVATMANPNPSTPVKVPPSAASYSNGVVDPDLRSQINTLLLSDGHATKYVFPIHTYSSVYSLLLPLPSASNVLLTSIL